METDGRLRQECLNEHWFLSLADARTKIEAWRRFYNERRAGALVWKTLRICREYGSQAGHRRSRKVRIFYFQMAQQSGWVDTPGLTQAVPRYSGRGDVAPTKVLRRPSDQARHSNVACTTPLSALAYLLSTV
ncbi:transposase (plasmid) [Curtobacterium flaccumfaciens pv. flaccumfaciens]|nr:transposase [Curtobacterium flaccumfaciens pv. flaccumfaciens]